MSAFTRHTGVCAPIRIDNVDTDQIIPSREMKRVSKLGLGKGLFAGWRYHYDGNEKAGLDPDFVLNRPAYADTSILYGGRNFGCGSSREHAVWALRDFGIRAIIAESFGRIFQSNCARNGVLAIELAAVVIDRLIAQTEIAPQEHKLTIDLEAREIHAPDGGIVRFEVDAADRQMLLNGFDYIDYTLQFEADIDAFVAAYRRRRGWVQL